MSFNVRVADFETRDDYHTYCIQFHHSDIGQDDDMADYFVDGILIFDSVRRNEVQTVNLGDAIAHFGTGNSIPVGNAHYEYVRIYENTP